MARQVILETENPLSNIAAVALGDYHVLALSNDGTVWAWGANCNRQLGDNTNQDRFYPVMVLNDGSPLSDIAFIAAGSEHSVAMASNGLVYAWGRDCESQVSAFLVDSIAVCEF